MYRPISTVRQPISIALPAAAAVRTKDPTMQLATSPFLCSVLIRHASYVMQSFNDNSSRTAKRYNFQEVVYFRCGPCPASGNSGDIRVFHRLAMAPWPHVDQITSDVIPLCNNPPEIPRDCHGGPDVTWTRSAYPGNRRVNWCMDVFRPSISTTEHREVTSRTSGNGHPCCSDGIWSTT